MWFGAATSIYTNIQKIVLSQPPSRRLLAGGGYWIQLDNELMGLAVRPEYRFRLAVEF